MEALYSRLCSDLQIDDEEPFEYEVYAELRLETPEDHLLDFGDPFSKVDRLCNLIAVTTGTPVGMCRVIWSRDDFLTADGTHLVFASMAQSTFLEPDTWPIISGENARALAIAWENQQTSWDRTRARGRVANALVHFYYAWRSHYMDQCCVNVAIALEVLFSPHHQGETTHQIAFNLVACSPRTDPCVMRVFGPAGAWPLPVKEALDEAEATQSGADHSQAAGS
ncbi:MAG TPA: hypothetical protein VMZ31_12645, partial [Phycisphaerae bacterium]|nr:hypothetical protein [Phycisphaerae bacterium]